MCGIAGYVGGSRPRGDELRRMSEAVAHRGPDDVGYWEEPGIGLAHRRLSIIDLSPSGHQPMVSDCGRYVIVLNGEIYNYRELQQELAAAGDRFRSTSDTEVLLAAWRRWGAGCLCRLNGMWAFAVWDRAERVLSASRDRFGKKPFYYTFTGGTLVFASEIKAIFALGALRAEPNPVAVADFAAERISDHTHSTFFRGVSQLGAGEAMTWREGSLEVCRYWQVDVRPSSEQVAPEPGEIERLLHDAVSLRLRSDVPVGCLLSGGIDSSAVAALAARAVPAGGSLHAFTTVNDPPEDEAAGVGLLAERYPALTIHDDRPRAEDFWHDLDHCLWHQEEPFADASMVAHFRLMRLAGSLGVKVLLTGQGADEVFAGYPGYVPVHLGGLLRRGHLPEFMRIWRAARVGSGTSAGATVLYAMPDVLVERLRRRRADRALDWLAPDYRTMSPDLHRADRRGMKPDPLDAALAESISVRTLPAFLHYEDRNSMAFGVETRLPFLDYRLAERMFRCPADTKLAGGLTKAVLRSAMQAAVPAQILKRTRKTGYPAPLSAWLHSGSERVRELAAAFVKPCALIDYGTWSKHLDVFLGGDDRLIAPVWRGLILGLWHQRFIVEAPAS
jgi:asparagine synthase (glutamine-hydrolysing)